MIDKIIDEDLPKNTFVMIGTHDAVIMDGKGKTTHWDFGRDLREITDNYAEFGMALLKKKGAFPYSRFEQVRRTSVACNDNNLNLTQKKIFKPGEKINISLDE